MRSSQGPPSAPTPPRTSRTEGLPQAQHVGLQGKPRVKRAMGSSSKKPEHELSRFIGFSFYSTSFQKDSRCMILRSPKTGPESEPFSQSKGSVPKHQGHDQRSEGPICGTSSDESPTPSPHGCIPVDDD